MTGSSNQHSFSWSQAIVDRFANLRPPRVRLAVVGISVVLTSTILYGIAFVLLIETSEGTLTLSSPLRHPLEWLPEWLMAILVVGYLAMSVVASRRVKAAARYQFFRSVGELLFAAVLILAAFRLVTASLTLGGSVILITASAFSGVVLLAAGGDLQRQLERARQRGSFRRQLDEKNRTWSGDPVSVLDLDDKSEVKNQSLVLSLLAKLHWIAPAVGIYFARYFSSSFLLLFLGSLFLFLGLLALRLFSRELALARKLAQWDSEGGTPLILEAD